MDKEEKVPELRFGDFINKWKQVCLGNHIDVVSGFPFKSELFSDLGAKLVTPKNFTKHGFGNFSPEFTRYTTESVDNKFVCTKGDLLILLTDLTQSCELLGKPLLVRETDGDLLLNQRVIRIENDEIIHRVFLSYFFLTESYHKRIRETSSGSTVRHSSNKIIQSIKLKIPELPEQQKIASFLTAVDNKIEQLSQKLILLQQYKKGLMQQLFSQKLRFKDDEGKDYPDWEEKKLGSITSFTKGKGISKNDIVENGLSLCIRYGELYTEYREKIDSIISTTSINTEGMILSEVNDILIPSSGETQIDIAKASCVMLDGVLIGGDINILKTNENGLFLSYYLNSAKRNSIAAMAQGNSVVHLYSSQLRSLDVKLPVSEEQNKIANCLSALDAKIDLVQTQLEHTQQFKKGLLQQMFV